MSDILIEVKTEEGLPLCKLAVPLWIAGSLLANLGAQAIGMDKTYPSAPATPAKPNSE